MIAAIAWVVLGGAGQVNVDKEVDAILARVHAPQQRDGTRIRELGDKAFPKVYAAVLAQIPNIEAHSSEADAAVHRLRMNLLLLCATAKRTPEMTDLYQRSDDYLQFWVFRWLAETGEPRSNRGLFEMALSEAALKNPMKFRYAQYAVTGLVRIGDDRSIRLLIAKLDTKEDHYELQRMIAWSMSATMNPTALEAVRRALHKGLTVPPLAQRSKLPNEHDPRGKENFVSFNTDSAGVKWALIKWDALGAPDDLWIVHWSGKQWVEPIFTGATTYWPHSQGEPVQEGYGQHKMDMAALIAGKGWVKQFVGNTALIRDSDHDGLTDVVEVWIGLDPKNPDSDSDGILDGVDKNPMAKAHPMSEDDRAMQAVMNMECLSSFAPNRNHMIGLPEGVEPFEIESCNGAVYLQKPPARYPKATGKLFGSWYTIKPGVKHIGTGGNEVVVTVQESASYYDLVQEVRVKKIGGEWFCVSVRTISSAVS